MQNNCPSVSYYYMLYYFILISVRVKSDQHFNILAGEDEAHFINFMLFVLSATIILDTHYTFCMYNLNLQSKYSCDTVF